MARKRKQQTPEQKAAKAAKEKARYQGARKAGFSPDEARSLQKSIKNNPEILAAPTDALMDLIGNVKGATDWLTDLAAKLLTNEPEPKKKSTKKAATEHKRRRTSKTKSSRTSEPAERKPRKTRGYDDFDELIRNNPDLSVNEIIKKYRAGGESIGRDKAVQRARHVRGADRDVTKITRFKYYSDEERPIFANKHLIKSRYMYLVQFEIEQQDAGDSLTDWLYVASNEELTLKEIKKLALDIWQDGYTDGREKYKAVRIIPESIHVIHAVDTTL